jgi:hypothetical protein
MADIQTFEVDKKTSWYHEIFYASRSSEDGQLVLSPLLQKAKTYDHGSRLKCKIHIFLRRQHMKCSTYTNEVLYSAGHRLTRKLHLNILFDEAF